MRGEKIKNSSIPNYWLTESELEDFWADSKLALEILGKDPSVGQVRTVNNRKRSKNKKSKKNK